MFKLRLAMFCFSIAFCLANLIGLASVNSDRSLFAIARLLEEGKPLTSNFLGKYENWFDAIGSRTMCLPTRQRAVVTLRLSVLDTRLSELQSGDVDNITDVDEAFADALVAIRRLLNCSPADGNAWLRLAMVTTKSEGLSESGLAALERSLWLAPHESWVVNVRAEFVARLIKLGLIEPHVALVLRADALTLARAGNRSDINHFLKLGRHLAIESIHSALPLLEPHRRKEVESILEIIK